jgi:predicted aspartyl protease
MAKITQKLTDQSPLAIVKVSVSSFPAQTPPVVRRVQALIDTGANWSVITEKLAKETGILDTTEMPSEYYEASAKKEGSQYAAKIAIKDFSLTTLVYVNFKPPPNATYSMLLGCAVLWHGRFSYNGMHKPKRFTLELPAGEFGLK